MITDARPIPKGSILDCDIAIVGSGPAGSSLALELDGSGLNVLVLEAGGLRQESESQNLYEGEVDDTFHHGSLTHYRRRVFGGTSCVWGGRVSPFDEIDFERRDYMPGSGWPITRADLNPFYKRAHKWIHAGDFNYEARLSLTRGKQPMIPGFESDQVFQDGLWRFSLPTNFAKSYRDRFKKSENIRLILHANCLGVVTDAAGARVTSLKVASLAKNEFTVRAKNYVLAAGGLEVTRLMLLSDESNSKGLGNEHDQLGRNYISHVSGDASQVAFRTGLPVIWNYEKTIDGVYCRRNLRVSEAVQRDHGLPNFRCTLTHPPFADPSHGNAILSAAYLAKWFLSNQIPPEFSKSMASSKYEKVFRHAKNVGMGLPDLATFGWHWLTKRIVAKRKFPSVALRSKQNKYSIHFDGEQTPNPQSRVILSDARDHFGLRKLRVQWRASDADADGIVRNLRVINDALIQSGVGRMQSEPERHRDEIRDQLGVGSHHIGTTRMSDNPREGIVDRNCRVHSVANLFIAAPSVFPTASFANPVLTTVAIAVRLADYLKQSFR